MKQKIETKMRKFIYLIFLILIITSIISTICLATNATTENSEAQPIEIKPWTYIYCVFSDHYCVYPTMYDTGRNALILLGIIFLIVYHEMRRRK